MIRIGFDARWIAVEGGGISTYAREILRRMLHAPGDAEFTVFVRDAAAREALVAEGVIPGSGPTRTVIAPWSPMAPASQVFMPSRIRAAGIGLFHSPNFALPLAAFSGIRRPVRGVVTVHDLIPLVMPDHAPRSRKSRFAPAFRRYLRACVRRADRVVTVSEHSRQDLIGRLALPPDRVIVIPNGVSERFRPGPAGPAEASAPEILYVGRRDPYKGLVTLVEALAEVRRTVPETRLRVIGPADDRYPEAPERAKALGLEQAGAWSGHVDDDELVAAYRRASVLALPSRYEGFGLPVIEAMACGTPVVCFRGGSLEEVAGGAALHPAPETSEGLATGLVRILTDPPLAARLREAGLARAAAFSWDRTAKATLDLYRRLLTDPP